MSKGIRVLIVMAAIVIVAIIAINFVQQNPAVRDIVKLGGGDQREIMPYDTAVSKLSSLLGKVDWSEDLIDWREKIAPGPGADLKESLPDIGEFNLVVAPPIGAGDVVVELFVSSEKSGKGTDGWIVEVAQEFNRQNKQTSNGRQAGIKIRKIASGIGYQFIASRKHLPQGYSPSNHLWIRMAAAHGVKMTPVRERMVGNIAGVVMKTTMAEQLRSTYGTLDMKNLVDAVVQGRLVMGYTNPFASSTGLNFLVTVLSNFAGNDAAGLLSPAVLSAFEGFQRGVPFVAMTTLQIRDSVEKGGSLDAFVMEYQTFIKTPTLQSGYEFIPFGILHDNPLYGVGDLSSEQAEVLELFAAFAEQAKYQNLANKYGFNPSLTHDPLFQTPTGDILIKAQQTWKEKKDAGRPIAAVFLADTSGSMGGGRINHLKQALTAGSEFISPNNSIGLVLFSSEVRVVLNIKKFNLIQKSEFHAAVSEIEAGGGTAMYNGITVALNLLLQEKERNPEIRPMLFVLTDGKTTSGIEFAGLGPIIAGLRIPIYTIGFEADIKELARLSGLVEAASLNAASGNIRYKIGSLLNAEM